MGARQWGSSGEAGSGTGGTVPAVGAADTILASTGTATEWDATPDVSSLSASGFVSIGPAAELPGAGFLRLSKPTAAGQGTRARSPLNDGEWIQFEGDASGNLAFGDAAAGVMADLFLRAPTTRIIDMSIAGTSQMKVQGDLVRFLTPRVELDKAVILKGDITPPTLTGDVLNYSPTGLETARILRINPGGARRKLRSLLPNFAEQILTIENVGTTSLDEIEIPHEDTGGSAVWRFDCPEAQSLIVPRGAAVDVWWDATLSRWKPFVGSARYDGVSGQTVGATTVTLNTFSPPSGTEWHLRILVIGSTSAGKAASLELAATVRNVSGTVEVVGTDTVAAPTPSIELATATVTIDVSGTQVRVRATGVAAQTIDWTGYLTNSFRVV